MTLAQLKTKANAKLVEFWDALIIKQEAYFLKHSKFFQLLITSPVVDGADTTWEIRKPNDERHAIDVDFEFNSPVPFAISVDEWVGNTVGFSVTATVELPNGDKYTRSRKAVPTTEDATYDYTDPDNPAELTPQTVTNWAIETTDWVKVIED